MLGARIQLLDDATSMPVRRRHLARAREVQLRLGRRVARPAQYPQTGSRSPSPDPLTMKFKIYGADGHEEPTCGLSTEMIDCL
jgi:hypothetical protein